MILRGMLVVLLACHSVQALTLDKYVAPKLVVVLVIDQFRADYLTRFESQFLPAGSLSAPGGFRFLMKQGAYFPFAQYDSLQNMTCPGHATISTGSRPATFGFSTNEWFDPQSKKVVYCTEDPTFGMSPVHLQTTTFGDELRSVHDKSRVIGISLKDRAAIMLAGHRANMALWFDEKTNHWTTSAYYNKGEIPGWAKDLNAALTGDYGKPTLEASLRGVKATFDAALAAIKSEKLGRGQDSDVLMISLSNHDILGHAKGPNSVEMQKLTIAEDGQLADFLKKLAAELHGLDSVTIALTADHGIPPNQDGSEILKGGKLDFLDVSKRITLALDKKFGSAGKSPWLTSMNLLHFYLNHELINDKKISVVEVENEVRRILLEEKGVLNVFTRSDFERGYFPPGPEGEQIRHSFVPGIDGDLVAVARPFFTNSSGNLVTHITGYGYDRSVPLIIFGKNVKPGIFSDAQVIDLAPTLSFILRILPPARSEGRVLKEIF